MPEGSIMTAHFDTGMPTTTPAGFSTEEFMIFLGTRGPDERWDLVDGVPVMQTPPTFVHQRIALNLAFLLNSSLPAIRPEMFALVEIGVSLPGLSTLRARADVAVVAAMADYVSYTDKFWLVAEIRSESNTPRFIQLKRERYKRHPDNLYCLEIEQDKIGVEIWSRRQGWQSVRYDSPEDLLELPEFGFNCHIKQLYAGTPVAH